MPVQVRLQRSVGATASMRTRRIVLCRRMLSIGIMLRNTTLICMNCRIECRDYSSRRMAYLQFMHIVKIAIAFRGAVMTNDDTRRSSACLANYSGTLRTASATGAVKQLNLNSCQSGCLGYRMRLSEVSVESLTDTIYQIV
jgi:hypothetical protein